MWFAAGPSLKILGDGGGLGNFLASLVPTITQSSQNQHQKYSHFISISRLIQRQTDMLISMESLVSSLCKYCTLTSSMEATQVVASFTWSQEA